MEQKFYDAVAASPVIAAVKNMEGLEQCLATDTIQVVFLLFGDICSIGDLVARVKQAGKLAMVHADLVTGLSGSKEIAVDFLHSATQADGIISTRPNFIRRARELHLYTVLRVFVIDSQLVYLLEQEHELQAAHGVEVAGRLVRDYHARGVHERAGYGHTLLLAAGELLRITLFAALEADQLQHKSLSSS